MTRTSAPHQSSPPYGFLFLSFMSLSVVIFLLYQKYDRQYSTSLVLENTQNLPTSPPDPTDQPSGSLPKDSTSPDLASNKGGLKTTEVPTKAVPTPLILNYHNLSDNFSVTYKSNRSLTEEKSGSNNRHVFYHPSGNITVHVGPDWSWIHPGREFSDSYLLAGQPTFVYEISTQKIVDTQKGILNYTVQCVHNGIASLKSECDQFIKDFKFLN